MVIGSTMKGARLESFARKMEAQGARTRKTKSGLMIYAPDGATLTIHTTYGDKRALVNDITWFRRHGLVHPEDTKEQDMGKSAMTNEEGYPMYVVGPVNGTTRKRVLAELESKGWPLRVRPTELDMDTVTAARALYNVGYRWDPASPEKRRVWVAPDDIREMHERVKAEMARREQEQKDARIAAHKVVEVAAIAVEVATCAHEAWEERGEVRKCADCGTILGEPVAGHEGVEGHPMQIVSDMQKGVSADAAVEAVRKARALPSLDFVRHAGHEGPHHPVRNPKFMDEHVEPQPVPEPPAEIAQEREFIDTVESWVIEDTNLSPEMTVKELRRTLEVAGLEVEIRVWRAH